MRAVAAILILILNTFYAQFTLAADNQFYAYYTNLNPAEIVVVMGEGRQLEFSQSNNYLPLWRTNVVTQTNTDFFPQRINDKNSSYIRLIEESSDKIIIHRRFFVNTETPENMPNNDQFLSESGITSVVHEIFTIYPDGKIRRDIKSAAGTRIEDWRNPKLIKSQEIILSDIGVSYREIQEGNQAPIYPRPAIEGNPLKELYRPHEPAARWNFDEGIREHTDYVLELKSQTKCPVNGLITSFKKGVSGSALAFDGYYTEVQMSENIPVCTGNFSIESWIALNTYPSGISPIICQSEQPGSEGFLLGIENIGHVVFYVDDVKIVTNKRIPLHHWTHIVATLNKGKMSIFIDGIASGSADFSGEMFTSTDSDIHIGRMAGMMQHKTGIAKIAGIQGLIDEVAVYDSSLTQSDIIKLFSFSVPQHRKSEIRPVKLPILIEKKDSFSVQQIKLSGSELWNGLFRLSDYPDIVINFENVPGKIVFWHGFNFAPAWITDDNSWISARRFVEKSGNHNEDIQNRYSFVRVIENTPARVVVHRRFAIVNDNYKIADSNSLLDEYYTLFPDGLVIRNLITDSQIHEAIWLTLNPGHQVQQILDTPGIILTDMQGKSSESAWPFTDTTSQSGTGVIKFNFKTDNDLSLSIPGGKISIPAISDSESLPVAAPWNNWSLNILPLHGSEHTLPDRISQVQLAELSDMDKKPVMFMYGLSDLPVSTLALVAMSWQKPAEITRIDGASITDFDKAQKSYLLTITGRQINMTISASENSPSINPCFVIDDWGSDKQAEVLVNGKQIKVRQGQVRDFDGSKKLIIWMKYQAAGNFNVIIK